MTKIRLRGHDSRMTDAVAAAEAVTGEERGTEKFEVQVHPVQQHVIVCTPVGRGGRLAGQLAVCNHGRFIDVSAVFGCCHFWKSSYALLEGKTAVCCLWQGGDGVAVV